MIICCPSCNKNFQIDANLIPKEGRNLQCGSCGHVWFYYHEKKIPDLKTKTITDNFKEANKKAQKIKYVNKNNASSQIDKIINKKDKALIKYEKKTKLTLINLIGYIIVFILSFAALILFLDTFQSQLSHIFPNIELFLFNLYEILKDIYLFSKDLLR